MKTFKTMKTLKTRAAAAAMVALTGAAQATLVSQGNGTVLDTTTNLIWLQDWSINGAQSWATQKAWAETSLDGFAGSNNWRLPDIADYGKLFTQYGDLSSNALPFLYVMRDRYWSSTEVSPGVSAWFFNPIYGNKDYGLLQFPTYAVAVHLAEATTTVPEVEAWALMLAGLSAVAVALRRRPL